MNRRELLRATPAAGLAAMMAGAMPAAASATETPVAALFREWSKRNDDVTAAYAASREDDDEDCEAAWSARWEIEKRLMTTPCENAQDWIMKICAWTDHGDGTAQDRRENPQFWDEARALIGGMV